MTAPPDPHDSSDVRDWTVQSLEQALAAGSVRGVRVWSPAPNIGQLTEAAQRADWRCAPLDTSGCVTKVDVISRCQESLGLPDYLGRNWDALEEVLGDIDPRPRDGMLVVWSGWADFADADPNGFAVLLSIWRSAAHAWAQVVTGSAVTLVKPQAGLTAAQRRELSPLPRIGPR